ncbi:MAG: hypothetical protein AAB436_00865 [Patescibacteria group bacterium]
MKLTHQTAVATLIQFIALSLFGIANGLNSIVTTCHNNGTDCISNLIVSLIFFMLTVGWFACVWILGYTAQERRSKLLAKVLIAVECMILIVAVFNARHHTDTLSLVTSLTDMALALWVISLAFRLMRSKGKRVVTRQRTRKRRPQTK